MTVPAFSLKGIATLTLIATGFATAGLVAFESRTVQQTPKQYPHGLSFGEVWQITRVEQIGPDILIGD